MEIQLRNRVIRTLPEGRRGTSGAIAGSDSMRTDSGRRLNRRIAAGITRNTTAETNSFPDNNNPQPTTDALGEPNPPTTIAGTVRKRTKWTIQMNKYIVYSYFYITKLESDTTNYRIALHQMVVSKFPELSQKTIQNIMDQKRSILHNNRLSTIELDQIKQEVAIELEMEETEQNQTEETNTHENDDVSFNSRRTSLSRQSLRRSSIRIEVDPIRTKWMESYIEYIDTDPTTRPKLPKLKIGKTTNYIVQKINDLIEENITDNQSLEKIHCLIYIGALTTIKLHNQKITNTLENTNHNFLSRTRDNMAPWERRLIKKIETLRRNVNILTRSLDMNPSAKVLRKKDKIILEYKSQQNSNIIDILDYCKQTLQAKAKRLKRYRECRERHEQNKQFKNNEKQFYNSLNKSNETSNIPRETPVPASINEFWKNIWSIPKTHNTNATWIKDEEEKYDISVNEMPNIIITQEIIRQTIKEKSNWKGPGIDNLHNYWIKKFTSTHKKIAEQFSLIIQEYIELPTFMTIGLTYLIPKTPSYTNDPSKYRPITCLPTLYKLLTSIITQSINNHLENNDIMYEEQKGCMKGSRGCKEQLAIDCLIHNQAKLKKRSLHIAYIDYQKAFDSIPHSWLMQSLRIYKINPKIIQFLWKTSNQWNTNLMFKTENSLIKIGNIEIKRGIFQGDSLSALWFCLALNPLSTILNKFGKGFKIHGTTTQYILNHLMYMDDIKLFSGSKTNLNHLIKITELFSSDICMNFGIEKCKIQSISHGKRTPTDDYVMENNERILNLDNLENYKYLGFWQTIGTDNKLMKNNIIKSFENRLKLIFKTKLSARNKVKAVNTFAIPLLSYSFGILNWSNTDLNNLNILMRTTSSKYRSHHPKSSIERFHLSRCNGGQGFTDILEAYGNQISNLRDYIQNKAQTNELHKTIMEADDHLTILNLSNSNQELTTTYHNEQQKIEIWMQKSLHGRYPARLKDNYIDFKGSLMWLQKGNIFSETEGFIIAIQDQVIATKNYRKYILKDETIVEDKCRRCSQFTENIDHITAGCPILAPTEYTKRHNDVARILHQEICYSFAIVGQRIPYYKYEPQPVIETNEITLYWDRQIITDKSCNHNRPDIVLKDKQKKYTYLIDIAIPLANNIPSKFRNKIEKYTPLANEIKKMWNQDKVTIIPIIIGTLGEIPKNIHEELSKLQVNPQTYIYMQKAILLATSSIMRKFLNDN